MQSVSKEQVDNLRSRFNVLAKSIHLEEHQFELSELKMRQQDPEFWSDTDAAQEHMKKLKRAEKFINEYNELENKIIECELIIEENNPEYEDNLLICYNDAISLLEEYELYNMFKDDADNMSCVIRVTAGAGGTEAQDWCQMLTRIYIMYCTKQEFSVDVTDEQVGTPVGFKSVTLLVEGKNAYGLLKCETGIHRLVRVSPFNAQGKRMTSFASVFVSPVVDDTIEVVVDKSRLDEELFKRSRGAGGQNNNKVSTACRLKYEYIDPDTGEKEDIIVENHETRKQRDNRDRAMLILKSILYKKELDRKNKAAKELEDSKDDIGWGAQIRSYVFDDSRVKDHRTGYQESNVQKVMDGNIDGFIRAFLLSKF